jgi:hypothetical protein
MKSFLSLIGLAVLMACPASAQAPGGGPLKGRQPGTAPATITSMAWSSDDLSSDVYTIYGTMQWPNVFGGDDNYSFFVSVSASDGCPAVWLTKASIDSVGDWSCTIDLSGWGPGTFTIYADLYHVPLFPGGDPIFWGSEMYGDIIQN